MTLPVAKAIMQRISAASKAAKGEFVSTTVHPTAAGSADPLEMTRELARGTSCYAEEQRMGIYHGMVSAATGGSICAEAACGAKAERDQRNPYVADAEIRIPDLAHARNIVERRTAGVLAVSELGSGVRHQP